MEGGDSLLPWDIFRQRAVWYIALAILASRLLMVGFAYRLNGHDADRYVRVATNLIQYGTYSGLDSTNPPPEAHDLPGFPLLLAGLLLVFKDVWLTAKAIGILNAFAYTLAAIEVYGLVVLVGGARRVAAWAMALFAIFPESLPYSIFEMPESIFLAVFLASLLLLVIYLIEPRPLRLWLGFVLLGLSALIKPVSLFFVPVIVVAVLLRYRRHTNLHAIAAALAAGLLIEAAVFSPWLARNYHTFGRVTFTTITGTNLFWYNYRLMLLEKGMSPADADALLQSELTRAAAETPGWYDNAVVRAKAVEKIALARILADPLAYANTLVKRSPRLFEGAAALDLVDMFARVPHPPGVPLGPLYADHPAMKPVRVALSVLLCLCYLLIVVGIVVLVRRRMWQPLLLAFIPILYFMAIYGPVTSARYRFAITPFLAMLAAYSVPERWRATPLHPSPSPPAAR
ncbi:MAG: ArnT family glycosyltransferase [Terriglobales bacterium]